MPTDHERTDPAITKIAEGAEALRDCATSIRTRLQGREQTLMRLRAELSALRSISEITILKPPPPPLPPPPPPPPVEEVIEVPPPQAPPPVKEFRELPPPQTPAHPAAPSVESILGESILAYHADPKPAVAEQTFVDVPISEKTIIEPPPSRPAPASPIYSKQALPPVASSSPPIQAPRSRMVVILPIACLVIISAFLAFSRFQSAKPTNGANTETAAPAPASPMPANPPLEEKAAEALAIVRQWRMAGDEKTLFMRLGGGVIQHPNGRQAWSVEKLDEGSYLVIYREAAGTPIYAFETRLKAKTVMPSPEATERLTLLRVRDEAAAALLKAR
jgi:hypothetical protein